MKQQSRILLAWLLLALLLSSFSQAETTTTPGVQLSWALVPPRATTPQAPGSVARGRVAVDDFVLDRLQGEGLALAHPAGGRTLLRRACFDLLGLAPTPEEVAEFGGDERPDAYERLIARLLASPRYGERWGRHWLDVVRYADTGGFETDLVYPSAWRYRDCVIRSLNADKPFDRFIHEQVADDELSPGDPEAALGTLLPCVSPALSEIAMGFSISEQASAG